MQEARAEGQMMEHAGGLAAERAADMVSDMQGGGHPDLQFFDSVRPLFVDTGLAPEPDTYELFYLHASGADPALSRSLERVLGSLSREHVKELRRAHLGDIAAAEVAAMVEEAQEGALALASRLERAHADVKTYDAALADEDEALGAMRDAEQLAELVQRLRRANATMMTANRRLEADIATATLETGKLLDRLDTAERAARTDPLTGLPNRRGTMDALQKAVTRALHDGVPLSVGLADIDHFKKVNDQWGHAIGDEVLRCVATHLQTHSKRAAGERGLAGRHGGEEFVVVLPGLGLSEAAAALDTARAILARQVLRKADDGQSLGRVSFSAGIALLRAGDTADSLVDRADSALYAAKRAGRDRVLPETPVR